MFKSQIKRENEREQARFTSKRASKLNWSHLQVYYKDHLLYVKLNLNGSIWQLMLKNLDMLEQELAIV